MKGQQYQFSGTSETWIWFLDLPTGKILSIQSEFLGLLDPAASVGLRWNGDEGRPLGNPQSRGNPTWFIVPAAFQDVVVERVRQLVPESEEDAAYRAMAADTEREAAALDWSNALIGDLNRAAG